MLLLAGMSVSAARAAQVGDCMEWRANSSGTILLEPVNLTNGNVGAVTLASFSYEHGAGMAPMGLAGSVLPVATSFSADDAGGLVSATPGFVTGDLSLPAAGYETSIVYIPEPSSVGVSLLLVSFLLWRSRERLQELLVRFGLALLRVVG